MKKALLTLSTVLFVFTFVVTSAFAAEIKATGTVKSVDAAKGTVVFCPAGTDKEIPLKAGKDMLKDVKAGDKVNISYEKDTLSKIKKARGIKVPVGC
jgi:Cu/Ag efflux protein CusF